MPRPISLEPRAINLPSQRVPTLLGSTAVA